MKISIIGAGNVGSQLAARILEHTRADVALVDIVSDLAKGKALDILDAAPIMKYEKRIEGGGDYNLIKDSHVVVVTAGFPRKPGMTREDLISKNARVVKDVVKNIKKYAGSAIILLVTNPLDIMTYLAFMEAGLPRRKIFGMAGGLDSARFRVILAEEMKLPIERIEAFVIGGHDTTMIPLASQTLVDGKPLHEALSRERINEVIERTRKRGAEIVGLLKTGSAYFSPSAACFDILNAIILDSKKIIPSSCVIKGEYGISGCAIGVPAKIGRGGAEEILEWELPPAEMDALRESAKSIQETLRSLGNL